MPIYKYVLTADIEIDAPNAVAAELAVRKNGPGKVRCVGGYWGSVRMPSQRDFEPRVHVLVVAKKPEKIVRARKNPNVELCGERSESERTEG